MKRLSQFNLNTKLVVYIVSVILVIFVIIFGFIGIRMNPILMGGIEKIADNNVGKYANLFRSYLSEDMQISRTISDNLETFLPLSGEEKMKRTEAILQRIYKKHPNYRAIYVSWERRFVDPNWNKKYGRIRMALFSPPSSNDDHSNVIIDSMNTFGDDVNSSYYATKLDHKDILADPYDDVYFGVKQTVTSVFNAMVYENEFLGSTGIDIPLSRYADIIAKAEKFYGSTIFLLSNDGVFVGNQQSELVGASITDIIKGSDIDIIDNIKKGEAFSTYVNNIQNDDFYVTFYPFTVHGAEETPWMVGIALPKSEMKKVMSSNFMALIIAGIIGLAILIVVIFFLAKSITGPITHITYLLKLLASGEINKVNKIDFDREDEIGEIVSSTNVLVDNLKKTATFAQEIGEGNLETEYESIGDSDILGNSLLNMRRSLYNANIEEENRRKEEEKLNWATVGYAKFGELLRNNAENIEAFTYSVISNLVKYTNSNQGALFLLNTDDDKDQYLTMSSCYAYERKKYVDKRIDVGSNLVGQCFLEGDTIYMTDIPSDYINITSGLGTANPSTLILVPLKFNEKVFGVIELASFNKYEPYQIVFIEKLGESIASTISTVRVNLQTVQLLEESKLKSEELAAQEEEMRQNMEELQTTQEESARRELDMNGILDALNSSYIVLELDTDARIININDNAKKLLATSHDDIEGSNLRSFLEQEEMAEFDEMWSELMTGQSVSRQRTISRSGSEIVMSESYTPIYNDMDEIYKVLNIGVEIVE